MDETIGVKGGRNDRRKILINIKNKKTKALKELEKDVRKKQTYTLIKTLPIVIVGSVFKELTNNPKHKRIKKEQDIVFEDDKPKKKEKTNEVIIVLKDGTDQVIEVPIKTPKENHNNKKSNQKVQEEKQNSIPIPTTEEVTKETSNINIEELNEKQKKKFQKLRARKIIDVYETQLKDIRYELRSLLIDYNTLIDKQDKIKESKEEDLILDRLNEVIRKIEELKDKIRIEDIDKYDDNYIYTLIEGCLSDFKDKKIIEEIKDSELYVLISSKLDEFNKKKDKLKDEVESQKEQLKQKEEKFEELKEKYLKLDKFNKDLNNFYREQELILKEMQEKIDKSVTVTEKVKVQIEMMNRQTTQLLTRLSFLMLIPGRRGAKAFAAMFAIYRNMAKQAIRPKTVTKKYKEIKVYDYSKDIENSINEIEKATQDLSKSGKDINKIITQVKEEFADYINEIHECSVLLNNLEKVKSNIKEKEYELERIKYKQQKELEKNNFKVLTKSTSNM